MNYAPPRLARWTIRLFFWLMAVGLPALALLAFGRGLMRLPWAAGAGLLAGLVAYEALVAGLGVIAFPDYRRRYLRFVRQQYAHFEMQAITRQGTAALRLERLLVPVYVDAKFINQAPHALLKMVPSHLRQGDHTLWEYFLPNSLTGQHFVVVGEPGSGKTTLLKSMAYALAGGQPDLPQAHLPTLPILLYLSEHADAVRENPYLPLSYAIVDHLARRQAPAPPAGWFEAQLEAGNCVVLLDGLNEVADPQMRQRIRTWVKDCLVAYPRNRFIISSRLREYRGLPLNDLLVLEVRPFSREQIELLANRWQAVGFPGAAPAAGRTLLAALDRSPTLRLLASNPLQLTAMLNLSQCEVPLPERRADLYAAHLVLAPRRGGAPAAQRQRLLQWLAYAMMCNRQHEIAPADALKIVARLLLALEMRESGEALLKKLAQATGALVRGPNGCYRFTHLIFQEHLAAAHIIESQLQADLTAQGGDIWWHETLRLYCGQTEASTVITAILNGEALSTGDMVLALECLEEALEVRAAVRTRCLEVIREALDSKDEAQRRGVAEALLAARLRRLARGGAELEMDATLVTCAEYQLFLDEQRPESQFLQPDHWPGYRFAPGEGQQPVVGVRSADALAFCAWLTEREPGEWRYRLPTAREVRELARPTEAANGPGYWTASPAGARGGKERLIFELAWLGGARPKVVAENTLRQAIQADLDRDLMTLQAIDLSRQADCYQAVSAALTLARELDHDLEVAQDASHDLESAQLIARDLAAALGLDLGLDVGLEFELARDRERNLGYDLSLTREPDAELKVEQLQDLTAARDHARAQPPARLTARLAVLDLAHTYTRARSLAPKLEHLDHPHCALARRLEELLAHNLRLALDRDLDRDLALALDSDRALANALALNLNRAHLLKLARARDRVQKLAQQPEHAAAQEALARIGALIREDDRPDQALMLDLVEARNLAFPIEVDLTVMLELTRAHARDRDRAIALARTLTTARDLARDAGRGRNRALARLIFLLNAMLVQPEAPPNGAGPEVAAAAVVAAERQQLSNLYLDFYVDFVTLEERVLRQVMPFEGLRLVRMRKPAAARPGLAPKR